MTSIVNLIASRPERGATAIVEGSDTYSYADLMARAAAIASALEARGVRPGDRVGVMLPRSAEMVASMLAVMGIGAAIVPLDPGYPRARLEMMARLSGLALLIEKPLATSAAGDEALLHRATGDDVAYVMFTSGTSGSPKCVTVGHASLIGVLRGLAETYRAGSHEVVLAHTELSFDPSMRELLIPLMLGGQLVLAPPARSALDKAETIAALVRSRGITLLPALLPSMYRVMTAAGLSFGNSALRTVAFCGEPLTRDVVDHLGRTAPGIRIINQYGPTEAVMVVACHEVTAADAGRSVMPIGRALPQRRLWIEAGPDGTGPLWVAGLLPRSIAEGDQVIAEPSVVATGDTCRMDPDGTLHWLGRAAHLAKIDGERVDTAAMERTLREAGAADDIAVVVVDERVVCVLAGPRGSAPTTDGLWSLLEPHYPPSHRPGRVDVVDALPRLPNGKVDYARLKASAPPVAVAPATEGRGAVADAIAAAYRAVIGQVPDRDASFFHLGGSSLKAAQLLALVMGSTGARVLPRHFLPEPTRRRLEAAVEEVLAEPARTTAAAVGVVGEGMTPHELAVWLAAELEGPDRRSYWNCRRFELALDAGEALRRLRRLPRRFPSLRARVGRSGDGFHLAEHDGDNTPVGVARTDEGVRAQLGLIRSEPGAPLWRGVVHVHNDARVSVLVAAHQVIADRRLLDDIGNALEADDLAWRPFADARATRLVPSDASAAWVAAVGRRLVDPIATLEDPDHRPDPFEITVVDPDGEGGHPDGVTSVSDFTLHLSAFLLAVVRTFGDAAPRVGIPVDVETLWAGPERLAHQVGFYPVVVPEVDDSFEFLARVQQEVASTVAHSDASGIDLAGLGAVLRDGDRSRIADIAFQAVREQASDGERVHLDVPSFELECASIRSPSGVLRLMVRGRGERITAREAKRLGEAFFVILSAITRGGSVRALTSAPAAAKVESCDQPLTAGLVDVFATQVKRRLQHPAVVDGDVTWTYAQLAAGAHAIAGGLAARGIGRGDRVALMLPRSAEYVAAVMGVLSVGAAFVPLDPQDPPRRRQAMLALAHPSAMIVAAEASEPTAISIESLLAHAPISAQPGRPSDTAYVMFTSGSTGAPKPVPVRQESIIALAANRSVVPVGSDDRVLFAAAVHFDAATFEIFAPLLNGGTVICHRDRIDGAALRAAIARCRPTIAFQTTALFVTIANDDPGAFAGLETLIVGGEVMSVAPLQRVRHASPTTQLVHAYGPTECTTFTTYHPMADADLAGVRVPIGRPLDHANVEIRNRMGGVCGTNGVGELVVRGIQVSSGYEVPAEPGERRAFENDGGVHTYWTGDLGYWTEAGTIQFLGRRDAQVKISGHRIELAEVERAVESIGGVTRAVAFRVADDQRGSSLCVAVAGRAPDVAQVRRELAELLPSYAIPSAVLAVDPIPLTPSGKSDRTRLLELYRTRAVEDKAPIVEAPSDQIEAAYIAALGHSSFAPDTNFFDAGGTSLGLVALSGRLRALGYPVTIGSLFSHSSLDRVRQLLAADSAGTSPTPSPSTGERQAGLRALRDRRRLGTNPG